MHLHFEHRRDHLRTMRTIIGNTTQTLRTFEYDRDLVTESGIVRRLFNIYSAPCVHTVR